MFGDIIVFLTLAERGRIWYIDEVMSVYRKHPGGMLQKMFKDPANVRRFIQHQKEIIKTFSNGYKKAGHNNLSWINFLLFRKTLKTNLLESIYALLKSFYYSKSKSTKLLIDLLRKRIKN